MQYHVFCTNPGMHRGGRANPAQATYQLGDHTPAQLRELLHDPHTHVVLGGDMLAESHVTALEMEAAVQKEAGIQADMAKAEAALPARAAGKKG